MTGRLALADLSPLDAEWAVADLSRRGHTVAELAQWLRCSPRHVKRIRARESVRLMEAYSLQRAEKERQQQRSDSLHERVRRLEGRSFGVARNVMRF